MLAAGAGSDAGPDAEGGAPVDAGADAGPQLPPPDPDTIYVVFYPASTTVTAGGQASCLDFNGYHADFSHGPSHVTYAVVATCPPFGGLTQEQSLTSTASHELTEAATDPQPDDAPAWVGTTSNGVAWQFVGVGGEIGDMCEQFYDAFYTPADFPYEVQRVWSNQDALASHDPCQPDGKSPYFNAAPVLTDDLVVQLPRQQAILATQGIKIPVGQSRTVELDLFSDGPMPPWNVAAMDMGYALYGKPLLAFSFDTIEGQNGDTIHLTITVLAEGPGSAEPFWIENNGVFETTYWPALVGN
jgi:hypothetical protein